MTLGKDEQRRARQDLLEAINSGVSGPICAPMPGVMLEMLELAAMEHRERRQQTSAEAGSGRPHLTASANGSRIAVKRLRLSKAVADVGRRIAGHFGAWRLSA